MFYWFLLFGISIILTWLLSLAVIKIALRFAIVDKPGKKRKIHKKPIPLLGGVAIFFTFFILLFLNLDFLTAGDLQIKHWLGFFIGGVFLIFGGILDDKFSFKPKWQIVFPIIAVLSVIVGGVDIEKISNPLGGFWFLGQFSLFGWSYLSGILIFIWLMGMMYTTKLLDGIDGLVSSVCTVGALVIFLFTLTTKYYQPDIALAALILAGACFGFLVINWHPAKIFLGEGGSLFLGFALGVLAIISGGKIAITLLVMAIPAMDVAWTIIRRLKAGKNPFKFADRQHLHFRLLDIGLSQPQTVLLYVFFSLFFGLMAIFMQSFGKLLALGFLLLIMLALIIFIKRIEERNAS